MSMKENRENYLEGICGCLERIEKKVEALTVKDAGSTVENHTIREGIAELKVRLERLQSAVERNGPEMEKIRSCLRQDSMVVREVLEQLDGKMSLLKKEPVRKLVTYRLESAFKVVVIIVVELFLVLVVSVWINSNQYRTNRMLKDADLKYRAIRICLSEDDPDIAFLEKCFTIERDEEKIRRVERLVTAFEDSVRNHIRYYKMVASKDSMAHRLFREAQEIRKQLDNPNLK